jgi:NAD(P) transhydrogenase subunit beta
MINPQALAIFLYALAILLFVFSLRWMSEVKTSRRGNWSASGGMLVAIVATVIIYTINQIDLLAAAVVAGAIIGTPIALKVPMTAVPQRTAMSHAFGSLAVALIGAAEFYQDKLAIIAAKDYITPAVLCGEMVLGFLTFTGSTIAFSKLQGIIPGRPFVYPARIIVSLANLGIAIALSVYLIIDPAQTFVLPIIAAFALLFGILLVMAIGGADMPAVIAILNSFAGISAAALGFVLDNKILIVAGSLDGSSGLVLAIIMSKVMNRSFVSILFGGVGATTTKKIGTAVTETRSVEGYSPEDVATILDNARSVVFAPGYGMAVSQAQHVVKELADLLESKGIDVKYAIHPVAGRMPGHMNVLLAEANVPYEKLFEMDRINPLFPETDVVIIVGANDVTNPAARTRRDSPLYGMPVLDVDKAKTVVFIKRSTGPGFSGVDNELFYLPKTMMVFGDAKKVLTELMSALKNR